MIPASRIPRMTPLTAGLPRNAARSGRCRAKAKAATKTRNSAMRVVKLLHFGRAFFLALAGRDAVLVSAQCIDHLGQRRLKGVVRAGAVEGPGSRRRYQSEGKEGGRHGARDDIHRSDGTPAENGSVMPPDGRPGSPA